jgi:hypothetical protein
MFGVQHTSKRKEGYSTAGGHRWLPLAYYVFFFERNEFN